MLNKKWFHEFDVVKTMYNEPLELKKVSGIHGKDEGNMTLPLEYEGIESIAILDSGFGISIATKDI